MANAPIDQNGRQGLFALSSVDGTTLVPLYANPTTHRLLVDLAGGSGTVTSVSVVSANGFAGTVATATTTPAITLTTTITGLLKGNGTAISAATAGTDYSAGTSALATGILKSTTGTGALTIAVAGDFPTLNQNTTGSAATLTTTRTIWGQNFNGSANVTGTLALGASDLTLTGSIGATGARATKVWATDAEFTNAPTIGGSAATGSTGLVRATSPTLVTPILGVATATSINGNTFTTGTYTLTGTAGKTLTFTNTLTLSGTDSTTMTFPTTTATMARTDAAQTFTGTQTFTQTITTANAITAVGNAATVPVTSRHNIVTNNSAATLTITLTTASAVNMQVVIVQILDFSAAAQTISWVNTENSSVSAPTTSNGSTTLPLTVGFIYNSATSKWRCIASA